MGRIWGRREVQIQTCLCQTKLKNVLIFFLLVSSGTWILRVGIKKLFYCLKSIQNIDAKSMEYDYDRYPDNPDDFLPYDDISGDGENNFSKEFHEVQSMINAYHKSRMDRKNRTTALLMVNETCKVPRLSTGGPIARKLDHEQFLTRNGGELPNCVENFEIRRFEISPDSDLIQIDPESKFWQDLMCYYRVISRDEREPDFFIETSKTVFRISAPIMKLPPEHEFIEVECLSGKVVYEDELLQVPLKPAVEANLKKLPLNQQPVEARNHYSVLILGMTSVSHQSFIRHMPRSHNFLTKKMDGIAIQGFQSLGPNVRDNVFPLLTGKRPEELNSSCLSNRNYLDDCPFIWKEFANMGYRTSYAEDAIPWSTFNGYGMNGFSRQPFDYDFRTFTHAIKEGNKIGHQIRSNLTLECHGSRLMFETLLENLMKTAYSLKGKPYWHMTWSNLLTATVNEYAKFGDRALASTLRKLKRQKLLDDTIFFILSDHGMKFGPLRATTEQGFLEERLPLLYVVLPETFVHKFPKAVRNLRENARKLVTAFDVHATLKHLISIPVPQVITGRSTAPSASLVDETVVELKISPTRHSYPSADYEFIKWGTPKTSSAVSLFSRIPTGRSCATVGVDEFYCTCLDRTSIDPMSSEVINAAYFVVNSMNKKIGPHQQCATLALLKIMSAASIHPKDTSLLGKVSRKLGNRQSLRSLPVKTLEIQIETQPGGGQWFASVRIHRKTKSKTLGQLSRINSIPADSRCSKERSVYELCECQSLTLYAKSFRRKQHPLVSLMRK